MSLKSKIEAVIYASEEPVTLVQLIGLLSEEAQAELDATAAELAARQAELALENDAPETPDEAAADTTARDAAPSDEDADALNGEVLTPSETTEELEASGSAAEVAESAGAGDAASDPAGDAEATEDAAEAAVVDAMADEIEADAAEASPAAPAPVEIRQPTPEEDEASAKAEARAKERELRNYLRAQVDALMKEYAEAERGIEIREVAGGFRFATKPEYHDAVRGFIKSLKPPMKLSLQALETLAVIAYKQPITAPEISEIRGVDSGGVVGSLIARKLVTTGGRKQVIGRPILYKTTKDFLVRFGLKDINELPSIEEFEKMAGELADMEPTQEEIPMTAVELEETADATELREAAEAAEPMAGEHEAQADGVPDDDEEADTPLAEGRAELEAEAEGRTDTEGRADIEARSEDDVKDEDEPEDGPVDEDEASDAADAGDDDDVDAAERPGEIAEASTEDGPVRSGPDDGDDIDENLKPEEHSEEPAEGE